MAIRCLPIQKSVDELEQDALIVVGDFFDHGVAPCHKPPVTQSEFRRGPLGWPLFCLDPDSIPLLLVRYPFGPKYPRNNGTISRRIILGGRLFPQFMDRKRCQEWFLDKARVTR